MTDDPFDPVSKALQARCGSTTTAVLADGKKIEIHNIAWGRDMSEPFDHITTNISPSPDCPHTVEFFTTDKVVLLMAPESGAVLYRKAADEA